MLPGTHWQALITALFTLPAIRLLFIVSRGKAPAYSGKKNQPGDDR